MDRTFIQKYFFSAMLIVAFVLGFILFWPFLSIIILAVVFSVLLYPLYEVLRRFVRFEGLASFLTLLCFVLILCIPLFFIGTIILRQSQSMYTWIVSHGSIDTILTNSAARLHYIFPHVDFNLQERLNTFIGGFTNKLGTIFTATISTVISFILMLLTMFYLLKDGPVWKQSLLDLSPLSQTSNATIITMLKNAATGIMRGYFIVGLAQGFVTGIGMYIFHVPHPALWGLCAAFASLIPTLGTGLVSVPVIVFLFLSGKTGAAVGYGLWALLISGTIDNILNPLIVGRQVAIHPLLVLFSLLGGVSLLGPMGLVVGPLVISLIYALTSVYKLETTTKSRRKKAEVA